MIYTETSEDKAKAFVYGELRKRGAVHADATRGAATALAIAEFPPACNPSTHADWREESHGTGWHLSDAVAQARSFLVRL